MFTKVKLVLVGPENAGKTTFSQTLLKKPTTEKIATIGVEYYVVAEGSVKYQLWDTSALEQYHSIVLGYIKTSEYLLFFINPLSDNFQKDKKIFFDSLHKPDKANLKGMLVVFTYQDRWEINGEVSPSVQANIKTFTEELSEVTKLKWSAINFSPLTSTPEQIFPVLHELCSPPTDHIKLTRLAILESLKALEEKSHKRIFKPDPSRAITIKTLRTALSHEGLSQHDIKNALLAAACDIRQPQPDGKLKYGLNFFNLHICGKYQHSSLYQWIHAELMRLDPALNLEEASRPKKLVRHHNFERVV